jgi:hypothetical protein
MRSPGSDVWRRPIEIVVPPWHSGIRRAGEEEVSCKSSTSMDSRHHLTAADGVA